MGNQGHVTFQTNVGITLGMYSPSLQQLAHDFNGGDGDIEAIAKVVVAIEELVLSYFVVMTLGKMTVTSHEISKTFTTLTVTSLFSFRKRFHVL